MSDSFKNLSLICFRTSSSTFPTRILFRRSINFVSPLCLITSVNSANWNIRHKCKPKCLSSETQPSTVTYTGLPITGGNCSKSATSTTVSPANSTAVEHIKISSNRVLILKNKSLETIENSSIITIFTSDNLFLKLAFILSLKPSNLTLVLFQDHNGLLFHLYLQQICLLDPKGEHVVYLAL